MLLAFVGSCLAVLLHHRRQADADRLPLNQDVPWPWARRVLVAMDRSRTSAARVPQARESAVWLGLLVARKLASWWGRITAAE